jgi:DNA primase
MKIENIEFIDALEQLAVKVGVTLSRQKIPRESKNKLFRLQALAAQYFTYILWEKPQGKAAVSYLQKRGLEDETIRSFKLGFAPDIVDGLSKILQKKGFSTKELVEAGLSVIEQGGAVRDRFRNRVMFPIWDLQGRIVAFCGRILDDNPRLAKYVNSPETPIYYKGSIVYGLNFAKAEILKKDYVVVVEGQMDVAFSHQAGIKNCVAVSGTAVTEDHLKILSRFSKNLYFCFDADPAGQKAAERVLDLASDMEIYPKIINLPFGKDAAEVVKKEPKAWQKAVEEPVEIADYYFSRVASIIKKETGLNSSQDARREAISFMIEKISRVSDPIIRSDWVKKLAEKTGISERVIWDRISNIAVLKKNQTTPPRLVNTIDILEKELITLFLLAPENLSYLKEKLTLRDISEKNQPFFKEIFSQDKFDREKYLSSLSYENKNEILRCLFKEEQREEKANYADEIRLLVARILKKNRAKEIRELRKQIQEAELAKNFDLLKDLSLKFQRLSSF